MASHGPDTEVLSLVNVFSIELFYYIAYDGHVTSFVLIIPAFPNSYFLLRWWVGGGGGPKLRYKDVLKRSFKNVGIPFKQFEALAVSRSSWKSSIKKGVKNYEWKRIEHQQVKRAAKKRNPSLP